MRVMFSLIFDAGIDTSSCIAVEALRILVSMSAIGSVMLIPSNPSSPTRLSDAGDLAVVGHLPEAQAAQAELAIHRTRTPAATAARVPAHLELGLPVGLDPQ